MASIAHCKKAKARERERWLDAWIFAVYYKQKNAMEQMFFFVFVANRSTLLKKKIRTSWEPLRVRDREREFKQKKRDTLGVTSPQGVTKRYRGASFIIIFLIKLLFFFIVKSFLIPNKKKCASFGGVCSAI